MRIKRLTGLLAALMFCALPASGVRAADWVSLTELPIKQWQMLSAKSSDPSPAYSPGIDQMKSEGGIASDMPIVINAKQYAHGIESHVMGDGRQGWTILEYDIEGLGYDTFSCTVGKAVASSGLMANAQFYVYLDGKPAAESPVIGCREDYYFEVDISGAKTLSLAAGDGGDGYSYDDVAWGNPVLYNKDSAVIESIRIEGTPYLVEQGGEVDFSHARALVRYASGAEKPVEIGELLIEAVSTEEEGKLTVPFSYGGFSSEAEFYVVAPGRYAYLSNLEMKSWTMLENKSPVIDAIEDGVTPANLEGVAYAHGIWTHPTSDAASNGYGELVWDVSELGCTRFRATVGKPNDTYCKYGQYHVYLDGKLLESSPVLYAGNAHVFDLDIRGGSTLTLAVTGGEESPDFYYWDSTVWADPAVWAEADVKPPIRFTVPDKVLWITAAALVALMGGSALLYTLGTRREKKQREAGHEPEGGEK